MKIFAGITWTLTLAVWIATFLVSMALGYTAIAGVAVCVFLLLIFLVIA